jgi:thiamine-monophosphate kinase
LPDEFGLIARLFAPLAAGFPGALGLTDDAALVDVPPGLRQVVTADAMVAGVHFLPDDPPELIARKLVRVNLSDLAAKGARPQAILLCAAFPRDITDAWLERFAAGLAADVAEFDVPLIGGDTVATPGPLTLSLTALGLAEPGRELLRSAATIGEEVWVSGTLGDSALGLMVLQGSLTVADEDAAFLANRYHLPRPRTTLGPRLIGTARAAMDVSDGLGGDLGHMCRASGVGIEIEMARLPLSPATRRAVDADSGLLAKCVSGGDDYEIVFTAAVGAEPALAGLSAELGIALTRIGRVVAGSAVTLLDAEGRRLPGLPAGYRHFTGAE